MSISANRLTILPKVQNDQLWVPPLRNNLIETSGGEGPPFFIIPIPG